MANDGTVAISAGSGTNVDVSQITRTDSAATVVERQRVVLGDDLGKLVGLDAGTVPVTDQEQTVLLKAMLIRLDILCYLIDSTYTPPDELGL